MIQFCQKKFQKRFYQGWAFSDIQKQLLMDIDKSVAIMDCVAGAGKTTILLSLAMWAIHRKEGETDAGCIHYMAENQELADDFQKRLVDLMGSADGIFPLGYNHEEWEDRLTADLRKKCNQSHIPVVDAVKRLEEAVQFIVQQYARYSDGDCFCCFAWDMIDILKAVLMAHHLITHRFFYTRMRQEQAELLSQGRVLVSTTATANKLNSGASPWSQTFSDVTRTISMPDEIQGFSHLEVLGLTNPLSF